MANLKVRRRAIYSFAEPMDSKTVAGGGLLLHELVATRAFQRLKSIRFLGGIDYILVRSPNGARGNERYTRYQHSLGVARLAILYCDELAMPLADRDVLCAAALLHDIGHAPLSHSLEPVFKELFGLSHHKATEDIVAGRVPLGKELYNILRSHNVDVERLIAIMSGQESSYHNLFAGPINFDTIEGILRAQAYTRATPKMLHPEAVTIAAIRRAGDADRRAVDEFWSYKGQVYRHMINSPMGVLADFACQLYMRRYRDALSTNDYFATEPEIFRKLPGLKDLLRSRTFNAQICKQLDRPVDYTERQFFIDKSADFFERKDKDRYYQRKEQRALLPRSGLEEPVKLTRDLFDDERN